MHLAVLPFPSSIPVLFEIGPFAVRWYALAYIAGLVFASWYMKRLVPRRALWGRSQAVHDAAAGRRLLPVATLGVVLGGRLGYVLFYKPLVLSSRIRSKSSGCGTAACRSMAGSSASWWPASSIGRAIGTRLDRMLDLGAASVPVGLGLGRLANFINGELYGRRERCAVGVGVSGR